MSIIDSVYVDASGNRVGPRNKGVYYKVVIEPDECTQITDFDDDCYSEISKQAYRNNEWTYVRVIVTPIVNSVEINLPQSVQGVAYGHASDWESWQDVEFVAKNYVPDIISEVMDELRDFRDTLNATDLGKD